MVDINKWFDCKRYSPKKKGEYLLMVCKKSFVGHWVETYIFNAYWNGKGWDIPDAYSPMQWKYFKKTDQEKYGLDIFVEGK